MGIQSRFMLLLLGVVLPMCHCSAAACTKEQGQDCLTIAAQAQEVPPSAHHLAPHHHMPLPISSIVLGILSCTGVVIILVLAAISFFMRWWHKTSKEGVLQASHIPLRRFSLKELQSITGNFSHKLGRKPHPTSFKGWIEGTPVAVKRVDAKGAECGQDGFLASVYQASHVTHNSLVKLLGYCLEGEEMMLVYEYLEAGSLDLVLLKAAEALDWRTRYAIASTLAQTILFLHEECGECLAHGNIKLENVLLGEDLCPKIADFGLADLHLKERIIAWKHVHQGRGAGSTSSMSASWLSSFQASAATDVYGFGLVLLSLVLGRGNIVDALAASTDPIFFEWIYLQAKQGMYEDVVDGRLMLEADPLEVKVALQLAFCCMQEDPAARPTMRKAWQALKNHEEMGLPGITSMFFGCHSSSPSNATSDAGEQVVVLDVDKQGEDGAAINKEIEPCYQIFSMRSHRRSMSSVSSV